MPNDSKAEQVRVVIDEASFDFRDLVTHSIEAYLDEFSDAMWNLREAGLATWKPPMLEAAECADGYDLFGYLSGEPGALIDRDTRNRFFGLISKCQDWDDSVPAVADIAIEEAGPTLALSIAYAHTCALSGQGVACLVFGHCPRRGFIPTVSEVGSAKVFFFAYTSALPSFWRELYELEDVGESDFFTIAERAFPGLIFNPELAFRRFDGDYRDLRSRVVTHLGVLNDHFLATHRAANGVARDIEATLTPKGCSGVSPEGPRTHKNAQVMRQRDILYDGDTVRCEWHSKIELHRNRIHFAFGDRFGEKVFIGIFVDHLDT